MKDTSNKIAYSKRKKYFSGNELDGVTNYPLREGIIKFLKDKDKSLIVITIKTLELHYPKFAINNSFNFLGSHDTERIITILGGESSDNKKGSELTKMRMSSEEREVAINLLKFAFLILVTMNGMPCIYYGDEIGLEGYRDPFNRMSYPWGKEDTTILEWVRNLTKIRKANKFNGEIEFVEKNNECLAYKIGDNEICANNL